MKLMIYRFSTYFSAIEGEPSDTGIKCIKVQLADSISNAWEKLGEMLLQL